MNQLVGQRYEILEKVGEGPLFTVYKARDKALNRVVAVKAVVAPYASDPDVVGTLQSCLQETIALNHPNITHFYEFGQEEGTPYAVVEFVRGINLKERIRRIAPFTLSVAVDFGCAIGEALHYAHSVGQIHGDLRPQNVVITPEGAVKITDFGVQKAIARSAQVQGRVLMLSAFYHAPELSTTHPGTIAGDIYAVGAMLYEMLTGTPVYSASTPEALADQHAFAPIPSPRTINPGVPRSVEGILLKCLQKRPEERYRSMAELLNDLKSVRDALRFGKPLSWSPIDMDKMVSPPAPVAPAPSARSLEPVAEVAASSRVTPAPSKNRLRAQDDRVSIYLKIAIGTVTSLIIACGIVAYGIYIAHWIVPPPVPAPQIVGKPIEEVRKLATAHKFRLIEHPEYTDKPRGIVFEVDMEKGQPIRANHPINVWYSRGPEYVNVPNVVNLPREEAEQKLKDAGLKVGRVTPEYSDKVLENVVINQDVTYKKRVFHDTVVDLTVSNGPNPNETPKQNPDNNDANNDNEPANNTQDDNTDTEHNNPDNPQNNPDNADTQTHTFSRVISINHDGKGRRQVRVEYKDLQGEHPAVIDEPHDEGDQIQVKFDYVGKMITLRVFYDDHIKMEKTFDPEATRKTTIH